jgi:adenylate cyclase
MGACVITDAERYASVAERIDPAATVDFVNSYLEVLFKPVFENGGLVSDVKGDGMLAVWAEHAPSAELRKRVCRACLQIAEASERFFSAFPGHGLATRIGAFYGPMALATVGTSEHHEFRAVGDTVNTASRLEALNKRMGTRVLVSASLAEGLGEFRFRDLGELELPGKRNRVRVLELLAYESRTSTGACPSSKATVIHASSPRGSTPTKAKLAQLAIGCAS